MTDIYDHLSRGSETNIIGQVVGVLVRTSTVDSEAIPPLTTAQQLALSVLLGEPDAAVLSALCDCLIEQGHEYATAAAEKARTEERVRCLRTVLDANNATDSRQLNYDSHSLDIYERIAASTALD